MKRQQAFSLIELSIVILVIGILIAGLMQGRDLISKVRLQTARSLTASSPVSSIKGLHAWYETSSNNSFDGAVIENNSPVTRWHDINPQKSAKLNLTQSTGSSKPTYKLDSLNNIPTVSFDGNDSIASTINMGMTGNPDFTFFVVAKVQGGAWGGFVAAGGNYNCGLFAFTRLSGSNNGAIYTGFRMSGMHYSHANLGSSSIFAIHVWAREANNVNDTFTGNTAFVNGKSQTLLIAGSSVTCAPNIAASPLSVGTDTVGGYLIGDIAEIIIFDRALKAEDRKAIEQYLSKKWGIKLTS